MAHIKNRGLAALFMQHFRRFWPVYLFFFGAFLAGLAAGYLAPSSMPSEDFASLSTYYNAVLNGLPHAEISPGEEIAAAFSFNGGLLLALLLGGLSVLAVFVSPCVLFYKGFSLGFCISFLLSQRAAEGLIIILLTVLPQTIFLLPLLLVASVQSLSFSSALFRRSGETLPPFGNRLAAYLYRYLLLALGVFLCAVLQGALAPTLLQLLFALV